jgi:hypothetical protein
MFSVASLGNDVTHVTYHFVKMAPMKRMLSLLALVAVAGATSFPRLVRGQTTPFQLMEATIPEMRTAMAEKRLTLSGARP